MNGLAEVLAAHRVNYHQRNVGGETVSTLRYTSCDGCDWLGGWNDEAGWEAHVAEQITAHLAERLAAPDVVEAVARAIHGNTIGDPTRGEPFIRDERETVDIIRDATAALTAIREALTTPTEEPA